MKKVLRKTIAFLLAFAMTSATFLNAAPVMEVHAAPIYKNMAHLKAGEGNQNGHFDGSNNSSPQAFVLSNNSYTNESFSATVKMASAPGDSRIQFVTKFVNQDEWSFIGFNSGNDWFLQWAGGWEPLGNLGLPDATQGDELAITVSYGEADCVISVTNTTKRATGTAPVTNSNFLALKDKSGSVGFGAAGWGAALTDIYFSDVTVGGNALDGNAFAPWSGSAAGYTWNPAEDVVIGDDGVQVPPEGGDEGTTPPPEGGDEGTTPPPEGGDEVTPNPPTSGTKSYLKSGAANGNGHFGAANAEAFVLSNPNTFTNETIKATVEFAGNVNEARFRLVTKYVDDSHWSYVAYDGATGWMVEYKNGTANGWPGLSGLPTPVAGEELEITVSYEDATCTITVNNKTTNESYTATTTEAGFLALAGQSGKVGFGAGTYEGQLTEFYFSDVTVGDTVLTGDDYSPYGLSKEGYIWTPDASKAEEGDKPSAPTSGRKWFKLTGGSNNGGGHNYGNPASAGPLFYVDKDRTMESGGTISMALKPSSNWGVFYSYIDDSNWLYVGYDSSSKWYYQYRWNGKESYPQIAGLPDPVAGEELSLTISLSNETLAVTVNGTTAYATNQTLKDMANALTDSHGNLGRFGVMTKGATTISFADFKYNNIDCMNDTWAFNAERSGQKVEEIYTAVADVTGVVSSTDGTPVEGATVRIGTKSVLTDENGKYSIEEVQIGDYVLAVSKAGYQAYTKDVKVTENGENTFDVVLERKAELDLDNYDSIASDDMTVYIGKEFPVVVRYVMNDDATGKTFFRGNETDVNEVVINGSKITPHVTVKETTDSYRVYTLEVVNAEANINFVMDVKVSVEANTLTWEVVKLTKGDGCTKIATIDIPHLNLLSVDAAEEEAVFAGAQVSTTTTSKADTYITFADGFVPSDEDGYVYAFLSNGKLSAGLHSNSEKEGDKRVERINGADSIALTSAVWYYESGDSTGQPQAGKYDYPISELPIAKVAIANGDLNGDEAVDWNDGAIAFRDIMHYAQGTEAVKDLVNYRIVMNFESAAPNPFLQTADNVKKVYLATDGLPQALLLKGYGNEGHDSANSEYADIAEREGGVDDFQDLIKIAHDYNTEIGIHVNAQEAYPEARSFNETMVGSPNGGLNGNGWGWLDQSVVINKLWDLESDARLKRFVQLYDRINGTRFYSGNWEAKEYVKESQGFFTNGDGVTEVSREQVIELVKADAAGRTDNMDFIYLDVWYQDAWETRRIAEEINALGWRFSTEFSAEGEYDSTWQHWSTDTTYGGAGAKGYNSDIIRFLKNDLRDSQVLNWPNFGGTADNPLLGGFRLYGFEGWGGQQDFDAYIEGTFTENLPTKFLQHYQIMDWENYAEGESPVGNTEKQITLANEAGDVVVVTRNEGQRSDIEIERTITLNGKVVLNTDTTEHTYLLPWVDNQNGEEKLYHWNLDGGTTTWTLQDDWAGLGNVVVYELSDQGRINEQTVSVNNGEITLTAKASTAYVVVKGAAAKTLKADFGECENVVDPGFNGYVNGAALDAADWSGDINAEGVVVIRTKLGDQKLEMSNKNKDVSVSTKISGLTKGEHYVAELYVANESDAKAALTVNTGSKEVSVYTDRSIAMNYISCDSEHGTQMNRMQVSFVAEGETATLTLSRTAGEGYTHWDDIRIVEQKVDNYKEDGSFEQDFESVVQGLYPFVLGYNAGGDSRTHLSQLNAPYTQKGWNGKSVDDVLGGEWSLKHHTNITGLAYRTIPQNFRFEPGKVYNVEFDYQTVSAGYQMIVGEGTSYKTPTEYLPATDTTVHVSMQVVGGGSGQTWIGLYMNGSKCYSDTAIGNVDFILDNLKITELKDVNVVTVSATELYVGEMADIYGNGLDDITWTVVSGDDVVSIDEANSKVKAIGEGTATVKAVFSDGTEETFTFTVTGRVAVDISRTEYPDITSSANTEEAGGEPEPSGYAKAATDGESSSYWHSNWSGAGFAVSESNPAVLTVDLGNSMDIGGFKFQQRPSANNGIIQKYSYEILDENREKLTSGEHIEVPTESRTGAAWMSQLLNETVKAKYIVIFVESGQGGFAAIAEVAPILLQKVATEVTLNVSTATIKAGETVILEAEPVNGEMLKGLVWTSSDEAVASVDKNGVATGVKAGTVTITVSNALGELATCTVTVTGDNSGNEQPGDSGNQGGSSDSGNQGGSNDSGNQGGSSDSGNQGSSEQKPVIDKKPVETAPAPQLPALKPAAPTTSAPQFPALQPSESSEEAEVPVAEVVVDTKIVEEKASEEVKAAVKETVTVTEEKATVTKDTVEKVMENTEKGATVILPLSEAADGQAVKAAEVPVESIEKIATADSALTVEFEGAKVTFEPETLKAIASSANGATIELHVTPVEEYELNDEQQAVLARHDVALRISAKILCNGEYIGNFGEGKARIAVPFTPEAGRNAEDYRVYYVAEIGDMSKVPSVYVDGHMILETDHFSEYAIVYERESEVEEESAVTEEAVTEETTAEEAPVEEAVVEKAGTPILPIIIVIVVVIAIAAFTVAKKKNDEK